MRPILLCLVLCGLIGGIPASATETQQTTTGANSPAIIGNDNKVTFNDIDARALKRLNDQLDEKDLTIAQKVAEAEEWARKYRELDKNSPRLGRKPPPREMTRHSSRRLRTCCMKESWKRPARFTISCFLMMSPMSSARRKIILVAPRSTRCNFARSMLYLTTRRRISTDWIVSIMRLNTLIYWQTRQSTKKQSPFLMVFFLNFATSLPGTRPPTDKAWPRP